MVLNPKPHKECRQRPLATCLWTSSLPILCEEDAGVIGFHFNIVNSEILAE